MFEYINKTSTLARIHLARDAGMLFDDWSTEAVEAFIERQPAADVVPVQRSRWIPLRNGAIVQCRNCKKAFENHSPGREFSTFLDKYRFCPFCGASMEES